MTTLGWVLLGGGLGALVGLICGFGQGDPSLGVAFGFGMGLLICDPFRESVR